MTYCKLLPLSALTFACEGPLVEMSHYDIVTKSEYEAQYQEEDNLNNSPDDTGDIEANFPEDHTEDTGLLDSDEAETFGIEIKTLAGSGEYSSFDGTGDMASFADPRAIKRNQAGLLIVADGGSGELRTIDRNGTVTTISLSGEAPVHPYGIAISQQGTIYISDYLQHCIFKIQGNTSEIYAGTCGVFGNQDGDIEDALFNQPSGLALKSDGALYVADAANNLIRMIDPKGNVSTIGGSGELHVGPTTGPALEANIYLPSALALHSSGDIYFSGFDHCIRRIHDGYVENIAGLCQNHSNANQADGAASEARFNNPVDLAFTDDEALLIADSFNNRIRKLSPDRTTVSTIAGTERGFADGASKDAKFNIPRSITIDEQGTIYVADSKNNRIRVISFH